MEGQKRRVCMWLGPSVHSKEVPCSGGSAVLTLSCFEQCFFGSGIPFYARDGGRSKLSC